MSSGLMAVPEVLAWSPGSVTLRVLVTVQVKVAWAVYPAESVTVIVTEEEPPVVGVPVMLPLSALMVRPAGSVPPSV